MKKEAISPHLQRIIGGNLVTIDVKNLKTTLQGGTPCGAILGMEKAISLKRIQESLLLHEYVFTHNLVSFNDLLESLEKYKGISKKLLVLGKEEFEYFSIQYPKSKGRKTLGSKRLYALVKDSEGYKMGMIHKGSNTGIESAGRLFPLEIMVKESEVKNCILVFPLEIK